MREIIDAQKIGDVGPADPDPYNKTSLARALQRAEEAEADRRAVLATNRDLRDEIDRLKATLEPALAEAQAQLARHGEIFAGMKEMLP